MSNPKELLISTIKEWIDVNNELVKIQKVVKEHREKKFLFFYDLYSFINYIIH